MSFIFISHAEEDLPLAKEIARGLEESGYSAWYFERDTVPGTSYLLQITRAIESCDAVILIATSNSVSSDQVTKEVIYAFEGSRALFPVLKDLTHDELKELQPEWGYALGGTAMITMVPDHTGPTVDSIIEGLKALSINPGKAETPSPPVFSTPSTSAPRTLTDKVLSQRASLEGERKQVTVLSCGISPTTSMDPEELHEIIKPCMDMMTEEVHRYEGTLASITPEGFTALFGAPLTHEDDPIRALRAALSLSEQAGKRGLSATMGLNTGLLIVGSIDEDLAMEYTAIGDTVNLASHIKEAAGPGQVLASEETFRLAEGYFDFQPSGELSREGTTSAKTYRALTPRKAATRVEASLSKGLSPFVGRGRELEHLEDCWELVKKGQGQVVGVLGEAGVGKSRLLLQFLESLPSEDYTYLQGGCLHYGEAIAYLPILNLLRHYFDISEGEDHSLAKEKIAEKLTGFETPLDSIMSPLQEIFSLPVEDGSYTILEPQVRRQMVFEAIMQLLITISEVKPLIMAVEDLHWIDKTSEEFLTHLIDMLTTNRILLIVLYRPEYNPIWTSKSSYSQIRVDQLAPETSSELISNILAGGDVAPEVTELIIAKASGNPLFIEELTQGLVENGSILKDNEHYSLSGKPEELQIPDTIQGIIAARLDRLEENLKRIMQVASVIGREFAYRLLEAITRMQEELKSSLQNLQGLEFIYEKSLFPELEYIFKHALTQDVAYNSLLKKRRKELHGRIGEAIEQIYADRLEEFYEMLAYHFAASDNADKALHYLKLSGDKATWNYSSWEAISFYKEAIKILDSQQETEQVKQKKLEICIASQDPLYLLSYPEGGREILLEAERLAEELEDEKTLASVYPKCARYYAATGDISLGVEYSKKCIDVAEKMGDVDSVAATALDACNSMFHEGDILGLALTCRRALELLEEQHREESIIAGRITTYTALCAFAGTAMASLGEFEEANVFFERGREQSLEAGDAWGTGFVEFLWCTPCFYSGDVGMIEHSRNSIERFEETGIGLFLGAAWTYLGLGNLFSGDYDKALDYTEKGLRLQRETGMPTLLPWINILIFFVHLRSGDIDRAKAHAEEALQLSQQFMTKVYEGCGWIAVGRVQAEIDAAERDIRRGISMYDGFRMRPASAMGYLFLGDALELAGRREEALENLKIAEQMGAEMGMGYWLDRAREGLARLEK